MKLKGNRAKTIATFGIASALIFGAGGTAFAAHSASLSSAALTSTISTQSVMPADQKLGLDGAASSTKGSKHQAGAKADDTVSSKKLTKKTARSLPKHSVSEADKLAKSGKDLDEKLGSGESVDAGRYLKTHAGISWTTTTASTYGEGDGLMGSHCSDGSAVTATSMGVAHKTLPLGTRIQIMCNGKIVEATVADRGPFVPGREIDLQPAVHHALGFSGVGVIQYRVLG